MDFASWTEQGRDPLRLRRLVYGCGVGLAGIAGVVVFVSQTASGVVPEAPPEEIREVQLATAPEEPEPEPEPEPSPEPPEANPSPGPRLPELTVPTEVPEDSPVESEVEADNPYGAGGDPYMYGRGGGGRGKAVAAPPAVKPPTPKPIVKKAKPQGPIRVTEEVSPPRCSYATPVYPAAAKASGIEGTVIVKFIVLKSGAIGRVKAVRGPAELFAAAEAAVKGARCQPATLEGAPVSVYRIANFPFRLKT